MLVHQDSITRATLYRRHSRGVKTIWCWRNTPASLKPSSSSSAIPEGFWQSTKVISSRNTHVLIGLEYSEQPDARVIDMASNYRLQYNEPDDTYYCLQGAQTRKSLPIQLNLILVEQRVKYLEFNDVSKPAIPNENQACQGQGQQVAESAPPAALI